RVGGRGVGRPRAALLVGGGGLLGVALFHLAPMLADAIGWRTVLPPSVRPGVGSVLFARWIGESVNTLLPAMQVGGNIAKADVLAHRGVGGVVAGASVVVDVTLVMLSHIVFTVLGLFLLLAHAGGRHLAPAAAVGLGLSLLGLAGFVAAQRVGLFAIAARLFARLRRRDGGTLAEGAAALDGVVADLY